MLIEISAITVGTDRREALPEDVQKMAESMTKIGLLSPITVDKHHALIAGLHRLEAAKLLGWEEIECIVSDLDGLQAELAEIDENFVRKNLSGIEYSDLLLRRKEIYEALHPETKHGGNRRSEDFKIAKCNLENAKSFIQDTADIKGVHPSTIARQVQTAKNLSPEAKEIIKQSGVKITNEGALKLSRLEPEQQKEAATRLASGDIKSIDEYTAAQSGAEQTEAEPDAPPLHIEDKPPFTFAEGVADLKNTAKDFSCTPDDFLAEVTAFARKFQREIEWYSTPYYEEVYPALSPEQLAYLRRQTDSIGTAAEQLYNNVVKGRQ